MAPVNRLAQTAETFLFDRAKKIARISASMQSRSRCRCRIKSALESKTGFHRSVIESANYEVLAVVTLRAPRQFLIFIGKTLHNCRPRNVLTNVDQARQPPGDNKRTGN